MPSFLSIVRLSRVLLYACAAPARACMWAYLHEDHQKARLHEAEIEKNERKKVRERGTERGGGRGREREGRRGREREGGVCLCVCALARCLSISSSCSSPSPLPRPRGPLVTFLHFSLSAAALVPSPPHIPTPPSRLDVCLARSLLCHPFSLFPLLFQPLLVRVKE